MKIPERFIWSIYENRKKKLWKKNKKLRCFFIEMDFYIMHTAYKSAMEWTMNGAKRSALSIYRYGHNSR